MHHLVTAKGWPASFERHLVQRASCCPDVQVTLTGLRANCINWHAGSEDGSVRVWHSTTYRLENNLNYGLERVWALAYQKGSNK